LPSQSLDDLERLAFERLDAGTWSYLSDLAEDGRTHARERAVLDEIVLRQRGLGDGATVLVTAVGLTGCWSTGAVHPEMEWRSPR
jgi:hypothetical protein